VLEKLKAMYLPLFMKLDRMPCLLVGGGGVAARKAEVLAKTGALLSVIAPEIKGWIRRAAGEGKLSWQPRKYRNGDCAGFRLVIAATPDQEVNRAVYQEACDLGIPVNVVDTPKLCTVIFGAHWCEGPLCISVSTGGSAPFMAPVVRDRIEKLATGMGSWVEMAARFRSVVRKEVSSASERDRLYRRFIDRTAAGTAGNAPAGGQLDEWLEWLKSGKN
jgi:uroporphyrin-III C-methyltransferase/precorrin-2 dehydrogenase/sirohydrochlorin ferrochelatase